MIYVDVKGKTVPIESWTPGQTGQDSWDYRAGYKDDSFLHLHVYSGLYIGYLQRFA